MKEIDLVRSFIVTLAFSGPIHRVNPRSETLPLRATQTDTPTEGVARACCSYPRVHVYACVCAFVAAVWPFGFNRSFGPGPSV